MNIIRKEKHQLKFDSHNVTLVLFSQEVAHQDSMRESGSNI